MKIILIEIKSCFYCFIVLSIDCFYKRVKLFGVSLHFPWRTASRFCHVLPIAAPAPGSGSSLSANVDQCHYKQIGLNLGA